MGFVRRGGHRRVRAGWRYPPPSRTPGWDGGPGLGFTAWAPRHTGPRCSMLRTDIGSIRWRDLALCARLTENGRRIGWVRTPRHRSGRRGPYSGWIIPALRTPGLGRPATFYGQALY